MPPILLTIGEALTIIPLIPVQLVDAPGRIEFRASGAVGQVRWVLVASTLPDEWDDAFTLEDEAASLSAALVQGFAGSPYTVTVRLLDLGARRSIQQTFPVRVASLFSPCAAYFPPAAPTGLLLSIGASDENDAVENVTTPTGGTFEVCEEII